jgi:DnaJ-class molecular chaperone
MRTQSLVFVFIAVLALTQCALAFEDFYCGDNTCYEVLELTRSASTAEIKIAYKKLSLK